VSIIVFLVEAKALLDMELELKAAAILPRRYITSSIAEASMASGAEKE
jgi:hypothetical protein